MIIKWIHNSDDDVGSRFSLRAVYLCTYGYFADVFFFVFPVFVQRQQETAFFVLCVSVNLSLKPNWPKYLNKLFASMRRLYEAANSFCDVFFFFLLKIVFGSCIAYWPTRNCVRRCKNVICVLTTDCCLSAFTESVYNEWWLYVKFLFVSQLKSHSEIRTVRHIAAENIHISIISINN